MEILSYLVLIVIVNGPFFAIIAFFLIRAEKDAKKEEAEKAAQKAKEEAEKKRQEALAIRGRIDHYKQSALMTDIIRFLTQHGDPYKITIWSNSIDMLYHGGEASYDFRTHGINYLSRDLPNKRINTSDLYLLGCAINELLGNIYTVSEYLCEDNTMVHNVTMSRPLRDF